MANKNKGARGLIGGIIQQTFMSWTVVAAVAVAVVAAVLVLHHLNKGNTIEVAKSDKIDITPTQIATIRNIGQWEFLSVSDEEIVDTVRHGFFSDDELVRIYYGTLRLGIDLNETSPDWITSDGDSITVKLPPVKLLDTRFIDEARTRSFFESGKWSNDDRAALYERARKAMTKRCLTAENYNTAEQNAVTQMRKLIMSMGFTRVGITFDRQPSGNNGKTQKK